MNINKVISRINYEINSFNESGGREDKACAEGLKRAKTYIQQEVLKSKILTHDQQVVLDWLKEQVSIGNGLQYVLWEFTDNVYEEPAEYSVSEQTKAWLELTEQEQFQVLAAFAEWGMKEVPQ